MSLRCPSPPLDTPRSVDPHGDDASRDREIGLAVRKALSQNVDLPDTISAKVRGGGVTLEGEVSVNHQRVTAERVTDDIAGVLSVHNAITVRHERGPRT